MVSAKRVECMLAARPEPYSSYWISTMAALASPHSLGMAKVCGSAYQLKEADRWTQNSLSWPNDPDSRRNVDSDGPDAAAINSSRALPTSARQTDGPISSRRR